MLEALFKLFVVKLRSLRRLMYCSLLSKVMNEILAVLDQTESLLKLALPLLLSSLQLLRSQLTV